MIFQIPPFYIFFLLSLSLTLSRSTSLLFLLSSLTFLQPRMNTFYHQANFLILHPHSKDILHRKMQSFSSRFVSDGLFGNDSKERNGSLPLSPLSKLSLLESIHPPDNKLDCPTFKKRICINQSVIAGLSNKIQAGRVKELCKYIFPPYFQSLVLC